MKFASLLILIPLAAFAAAVHAAPKCKTDAMTSARVCDFGQIGSRHEYARLTSHGDALSLYVWNRRRAAAHATGVMIRIDNAPAVELTAGLQADTSEQCEWGFCYSTSTARVEFPRALLARAAAASEVLVTINTSEGTVKPLKFSGAEFAAWNADAAAVLP